MGRLHIPRWITAEDSVFSEKRIEKLFLCSLAGWMILWTLLPSLVIDSYFVDVAENIVWGSHFQFGYDKNPPLGAWITRFFHEITGGSMRVHFLLSQLCVGTALFSVWCLAREMVSPIETFMSSTALFSINFYGMKAVEFCDDVMEHAAWPLLILFFYKALTEEKNRTLNWCMTGFFAAAALMIKYFVPVLFLPMFLVMLLTKEGRRAFREKGVWLALLIFLLLISGNVVWLFRNHFAPFGYAVSRANLHGKISWLAHLAHPWEAFHRALGVFIFPVAAFIVVFFCPRKKSEYTEDLQHRKFNLIFLTLTAWGPFFFALAFSAVSGGTVNYSWLQPCFFLVPLWCFYVWRPRINRVKVFLYAGQMFFFGALFGIIFAIRSLEYQGYRKRGCDRENFPVLAVAERLENAWKNTFGSTPPHVIGDRMICCGGFIRSRGKTQAFFECNAAHSQWIDPEDVRKRGGILVWEDDRKSWMPENYVPDYIAGFRREYGSRLTSVQTFSLPRAVPLWYRFLRGKPKETSVAFCFLSPEK